MSTNSDLASWGEPPATPTEEALGTLLDKLLTKIESGKAVKPESLRGDRPELLARGQELVRALGLLFECAASVWENSALEPADQSGDSPRSSTVSMSSMAQQGPAKAEDKMRVTPVLTAALPNPFPGEFRVLQVLGEGAFGRVLLAEDLNLGWQVALKTLKLPATSTVGPQVLAALRTEAQHLAQLDHPNIVRVHAWREAGGEYYLVLQFVAGGSLGDKLKKENALGWQDAARYVADVGEALVEAHKRGVVHRDIKPDNILWDTAKNEAILTDFGVSARLAEPGTVAGTPVYMAPEAFEGRVSPALDVYSLAATFYQLVTGKMPFPKTPVPSLVYQKIQGLPDPDPNCAVVPEALERIIRAGLVGKPEGRPSMADFVAMLRGTLNQLMADALIPTTDEAAVPGPVDLRVVVSRLVSGGTYKPIGAMQREAGSHSRDMKKVPRTPEHVSLRTGDRVRVEVIADQAGCVTVFNVGPTGNLNLLYPDEEGGPSTIEANKPLHIIDVEMMPPTGEERLFAVWSRTPLQSSMPELLSLTERGPLKCSKAYRTSRDMKRVKQTVKQLPREDWHAVVLELDHN